MQRRAALVITLLFALERFSIETNTSYPINQSDLEVNTSNRRQARENFLRPSRDWLWFYF